MTARASEHISLWELNPIWKLLTPGEKNYIASESEYVKYRKNEVIHRIGDVPTHMMILVRGKVKIYLEGAGQKPQIIRMLKPSEVFGYRAIVAGDEYNTNASAVEESLVLKLSKEAFLHITQQNCQVCYGMLELMSRDLAISEAKAVNLTQKHIRGRLAEALVTISQKYGLEPETKALAVNVSREDLANMSCMTTSNAIRTLSQFAQEGIIRLEGKRIILEKEEELKKISQLG